MYKGELRDVTEPGNQLFYCKDRFLTCSSLAVIWVSRNESRSYRRRRKDRSRTLICARSLNRMPVPSFNGSWKPGVLRHLKTYDPYATHSISHKDKIHKGGEVEGLLHLCCSLITKSYLCCIFVIDYFMNRSLQN